MLKPPLFGFGALTLAALLVAAAMPAAAQVREHVSFTYQKIIWTAEIRKKIENDFRRIAAERGLGISSAEVAGAAQAAFDGGLEYTDTWEEQTVIRGCGPAGELCFVIHCTGCRGK